MRGLADLCEGVEIVVPVALPEHSMRLLHTLGVEVRVDPLASPPCSCEACMIGWRRLVRQLPFDPRNLHSSDQSEASSDPSEFPEILKARRKAAGLSQRALAEAVGMHQGRISGYERGQWQPRDRSLERLESVLGRLVR